MALQASGPISFSQISNEFGLPPGKNLGSYIISRTISGISSLALDNEVNGSGIITAIMPQSGSIKFSDFYNKKLNVVVNCGSGTRITARSRYDSNVGVIPIGEFKTRPPSSTGIKVWIHTNETIGSNVAASSTPNRQYSSLITGSGWESDTDLRLDIGPDGLVSGAGGNGGTGGSDRCGGGGNGEFGTSAIGVNYQPIIITNRGRIQGGTGGGGGGGAAYGENRRRGGRDIIARAGGGGGGGGMGSPAGSGGGAGGGTFGTRAGSSPPSAGGVGSLTSQGAGGGGGSSSGEGAGASGGSGGAGGDNGGSGSAFGFDGSCGAAGGSAGQSGFSIIITNDGTGVTVSNLGTLIGAGITYNTLIS